MQTVTFTAKGSYVATVQRQEGKMLPTLGKGFCSCPLISWSNKWAATRSAAPTFISKWKNNRPKSPQLNFIILFVFVLHRIGAFMHIKWWLSFKAIYSLLCNGVYIIVLIIISYWFFLTLIPHLHSIFLQHCLAFIHSVSVNVPLPHNSCLFAC